METSTILQNALRRSTGDYPSEWHCSCLFDHPEKNKTLTRQRGLHYKNSACHALTLITFIFMLTSAAISNRRFCDFA